MSSAQEQQKQIEQGQSYISKDQRKHEKDLEKARQLGQIPAEKDEDGKDINPHMPKFITKAPWYLDKHRPSLQHQKWFEQKEKSTMDEWYARGQKGYQATSYRKGACTNCGAMTHKAKDCVERPRKKGAKWTGQNIKADEIIVDLDLDYAAKRDRYNGYNPDQYMGVIQEHEVFEEERKKKKADLNCEGEEDTDYIETINDYQYNTTKTKSNTMNLRKREDRAVYLENLDVNSAFYDPKSRAMRDNPNPHLPEDQQGYQGLNYVRNTGETGKILSQEVFAWEKVQNKGAELSSVAMPSATEKFFNKQKQQDIEKKNEKMQKLIDQYGGGEHLKNKEDLKNLYQQTTELDKEEQELEQLEQEKEKELNLKLKNVQTAGGKAKTMKLSKYPEDQLEYGHTTVWGSWWNEVLGWGYSCCHSTDRQEYCEGPKAKKLATIREYHAKKAAEQKLKEFEEQKAKEIEETEELEQEQVKQNQQQENFQAPVSKAQKQEDQQDKEQDKDNNEEEIDLDSDNESSSGSSSSSSSSSSSDSSSSGSSSDSSSSDSDSSSSSSSESESESEDRKKKKNKKKQKQVNKKKKKVVNKKDEKRKRKQKDNLQKLDQKKVEEAVKREKERKKQVVQEKDDRKRKYNSMRSDVNYEPTEEEIEAYKLTKTHHEDPMANYNDVD